MRSMARLPGISTFRWRAIEELSGASAESRLFVWFASRIAETRLGFDCSQVAAVKVSSKCEAVGITKKGILSPNNPAISGGNAIQPEQDPQAQLPLHLNSDQRTPTQSIETTLRSNLNSHSVLPPELLATSRVSWQLGFRSPLHLPIPQIVGPLINKLTTTNPSAFTPSSRLLSTLSSSHLHPRPTSASQPPLLNSHRHYHSTHAPINTSDEATATRPGQHRSPVIDKLWRIRNAVEPTNPAADYAKPPQKELITKKPSDSVLAMEYPLSKDLELREKYRNPWDSMRIGRLLEDLDAIAGSVAFQHCSDNDAETRPLLLVTASVDRIRLARSIRMDADLAVTAKVIWVGRSSMEIQIRLDQPSLSGDTSDSRPPLVANFTFVARDLTTNKAAQINPLAPETDEEKALFAEGEARDAARKWERQQRGVGKNEALSKEYRDRLEAFLAAGRTMLELPALADRNSMLIRDTRLENAFLCQPQQRNMHGRIFGGFLMRRAFELAFSTCYVFCGTRPAFLEMHDITFQRPVDVGDLLRFKACVLYTEQSDLVRPLIHVEVVAYVTKPELRTSQVSNTFYFTFTVHPDDLKNHATVVRRVLPSTEEEARRYMSRFDADHS